MTTPTIRDALDTFQQAANSGTAVYVSSAIVQELREALETGSEGPVLQWTDNMSPCEACRYDHCIAETPFGRFLITWKSWTDDCPTVDETPWGVWLGAFDSVDDAKAACQQEMNKRLARWCGPVDQPVATPAPEEPETESILRLAAIIREVDGNNHLGAAALAELILAHPGFAGCHDGAITPPAQEPGGVGELAARLTLISEGMSKMDQEEDSWFVARGAIVIAQQAAELAALRGVPVPTSQMPWDREGWCDSGGRCWLGSVGSRGNDPGWVYRKPCELLHQTISLPHNAIPLPAPQAGEGEA